MKTRFQHTAASIGLTLLLLFASPFQICFEPRARAQQNAPQAGSLKVNAKNIGGAFELPAETLLYGEVKVYLPDDMAAGDTISGTVVAEPKGNTAEERARNQGKLESLVVQIGEQRVPVSDGTFKWVVPDRPAKLLYIIDVASGKEVAQTQIPPIAPMSKTTPSQTSAPGNFQLPTIGQQGRVIEIPGPFDGDFSNTALNWKATQDSENNTENIAGGFGLIAESPRKAVFRSPRNVTGPIEINLKEGSVETKGIYRNIGVRLSAPKTDLLKGERTTLTVTVLGLQGIQQPVPLLLVKGGVVEMQGGDVQFIPIASSALQANGTFIATRTITGRQAGGFSVTATVIARRFDACLKDDNVPATAGLWNTYTGDYNFTQASGANTKGTGKTAIKGCIITLSHNAPDRRVFARLDVCTNSGSASVETSSPKAKFTITDGNTTDNSCTVPR